jgi:hypothetical protein
MKLGGDARKRVFQDLEVDHDAHAVQGLARRHDLDPPIVAVQRLDRTSRLREAVRRAERRLVGDLEHQPDSFSCRKGARERQV